MRKKIIKVLWNGVVNGVIRLWFVGRVIFEMYVDNSMYYLLLVGWSDEG